MQVHTAGIQVCVGSADVGVTQQLFHMVLASLYNPVLSTQALAFVPHVPRVPPCTPAPRA